jgi:hypothetical protein
MKTLRWSLGLMLLMPLGAVSTQAQQDVPPPAANQSPADAAAAAKADAAAKTKKARVWDNENIPKAGDEISVVGQPIPDQSSAASTSGSDGSANGAPAAPGASDKDKEKKEEAAIDGSKGEKDQRVAAAKEKLENLKRDLDLQSRKLTLDSETYFGKPDYKTDTEGAEQLQNEKDGIASKQAEVDAAQKELDDLVAQLGGAPAPVTNNLPN